MFMFVLCLSVLWTNLSNYCHKEKKNAIKTKIEKANCILRLKHIHLQCFYIPLDIIRAVYVQKEALIVYLITQILYLGKCASSMLNVIIPFSFLYQSHLIEV